MSFRSISGFVSGFMPTRLLGALGVAALLCGCQSSASTAPAQATQHDAAASRSQAAAPANVPTPPSADQVSPSSPQAILNGTSTTQPAAAPRRH